MLFTEFRLGSLLLKNRVVGLPHGSAMVDRGVPTDDDLAYWEARAAGGAGLLIVGGTVAHRSGLLRDRRRAEVWNPAALEALARRAETVHRHGAAMFVQLNHLGRESVGGTSEYAPVAPSAVRSPRDFATPHPLTIAEIEELVEAFVTGAENLDQAGYDGVELHAGHGYLLAQFLSPAVNRREDRYGGDLAGRMRFLTEMIEGIRARCRPGFALGVRLSADEEIPDGLHLGDTLAIVRVLTAAGGVDYLNITRGQRGAYVKDITHPEGVAVPLAAAVKASTSIPVLVAGRIVDPAMAEDILRRGDADLVGIARALIADPQWPAKAAAGNAASIRPCIAVNQECRTFPGGILCAANARTGRERWFAEQMRDPRRADLELAVVGGGPAGLEAARFAAELGARVVLFEREARLGGQLRLAAAVPSRAGLLALATHLEHEARRLGVDVRLDTAATPELLQDAWPDAVIVATGARALDPPYDRDSATTVVTVWDVLRGTRPDGARAVVVDDGTGFWDAVSAAELLADAGCAVALVTPAASAGTAIPFESIGPLRRRLAERAVACHPFSRVTRVAPGVVHLAHTLTGEPFELAADFVAGHAGTASRDELVAGLGAGGATVRAIGDCVSPRRLTNATWEADRAVLELLRAELNPAATAPSSAPPASA
jgi:2,4-dienoyl-CoA reductase (NADPH2)